MPVGATGSDDSFSSASDERTLYENCKWTSTLDLDEEEPEVAEELKILALEKRQNLVDVKAGRAGLSITKIVMFKDKPGKVSYTVKQWNDKKGLPGLIIKFATGTEQQFSYGAIQRLKTKCKCQPRLVKKSNQITISYLKKIRYCTLCGSYFRFE